MAGNIFRPCATCRIESRRSCESVLLAEPESSANGGAAARPTLTTAPRITAVRIRNTSCAHRDGLSNSIQRLVYTHCYPHLLFVAPASMAQATCPPNERCAPTPFDGTISDATCRTSKL